MAATNQNFNMFEGETLNIVVGPVTNTDGSTVNLTGSTIKWAIKKSVNSASNDVYKDTISGGISITDAINGKFTISLVPNDTKPPLVAGDYYHEAKITDSSGNVSVVMTGRAVISQSGVS